MDIVRTLPELRQACATIRRGGSLIGFVPTMGALHDGHCALVQASAACGAATVASIFVNPLQFSAQEDLTRYPRDEAGDLAILRAQGCTIAWLPDVATMYPPGEATTISLTGPAERWEGDMRPGHFRGVATVCAKLFGQVRPDHAYFGEKDWQQLQVIRRMVADLLLPLEIVGVPTVREPDGLAMSSRNRFLSATEREIAGQLPAEMTRAATALVAGALPAPVLEVSRAALAAAGFEVDYLALVDGPSLVPTDIVIPDARLIVAARIGSVRLLDNIGLQHRPAI